MTPAASLIAIGDLQEATGDLMGAVASYTQAHDLLEPLVRSHPDNLAVQRGRGEMSPRHRQGPVPHWSCARSTRFARAGSCTPAKACRRQSRQHPVAERPREDLSRSSARFTERAVERTEALSAFEQARAISQKLTEADPLATQFQSDLAQSYIDVGLMHQETEDFTAALASFEQAQAILEG